MTYLSRLRLVPRSLSVVRDLGDVREMHRTLMRAFPSTNAAEPRAAFGVLYRVDAPTVLVQSEVEPDWSALPPGHLRSFECKAIDEALDTIVAGRVLRFCLVANPSRKLVEPDRRNSRRVELRTDDERFDWLTGRGARHGFELTQPGPQAGVRIDRVLQASVTGRSKITVKPVRFEGLLTVTDADVLRQAIRGGLGPAKAYGCGLLSVGPA